MFFLSQSNINELVYNFIQRVQLQSDSNEYVGIERLFKSTMRNFSVRGIERIQNRALWEVFQWYVHKP